MDAVRRRCGDGATHRRDRARAGRPVLRAARQIRLPIERRDDSALGVLAAVVVAMIGVYATVSYGVTQRTHEFGIRAALGARFGDIRGQVVGDGVKTVAVGVALGIALTLVTGRVVAAMLDGVAPRDPAVLGKPLTLHPRSPTAGRRSRSAPTARRPPWRGSPASLPLRRRAREGSGSSS